METLSLFYIYQNAIICLKEVIIMDFSELLEKYYNIINCSSKDLATACNLSKVVISRYKNGERIPKYDSDSYNKLIDGLYKLCKENKVDISKRKIKEDFENVLNKDNINFELFRNNMNYLIDELNLNAFLISKYLGYDASYISKIRNGIRKPNNLSDFAYGFCKYLIDNKYELKNIIENSELNIDILYKWITNNEIKRENYIENFLNKLDEFDLDDYIKTIKFDKLKVPTLPFDLPKNKTYYNLDGYKNSQLDILKHIILSKSKSDVFFYSNMEMTEASKDLEFTKKFMIGLALMLKKGLKLNIIHDLDRPFKELMLGLEGWIPLYMTGLISPHYFNDNSNELFSQIMCVNDVCALYGYSISNNNKISKYVLTTKKEDLMHYQECSKTLLRKSKELMNIYTLDNINEYLKERKNYQNYNRKNILFKLPIYLISDELLLNILDKNNINKNDKNKIIKYVKEEKNIFNNILKNNKILDCISILDEESFNNNEVYLDIPEYICDKKIKYNYSEYLIYYKLIKNNNINNYSYQIHKSVFKNITINIIDEECVIITKEKKPNIYFVIKHKKLVRAINNFESQLKEEIYEKEEIK